MCLEAWGRWGGACIKKLKWMQISQRLAKKRRPLSKLPEHSLTPLSECWYLISLRSRCHDHHSRRVPGKKNGINIVSTAFVTAFSHSIKGAAQNQTTRTSGLAYNNRDEKIAVCFWSSLLRWYSVCVAVRGWKKAGKSSVMCKVHFYCHYTIQELTIKVHSWIFACCLRHINTFEYLKLE